MTSFQNPAVATIDLDMITLLPIPQSMVIFRDDVLQGTYTIIDSVVTESMLERDFILTITYSDGFTTMDFIIEFYADIEPVTSDIGFYFYDVI
ncbi:hypothetical protein [Candidatus Xianfuyuplasma coldseepsis]|uniref:Uncharacterized protein n=1 Tax=Candidatus Xianfuyuplasma coldseepsis TaxID=2782163 RepID=A0A7L7KQN5_9MOLU|nr:hypothetical protein [Xianfuyuplasma coldseepsis]QMS85121.1 hypothetical protein G4Z02_04970 [Xianfuyuplasma coldseepsis]